MDRIVLNGYFAVIILREKVIKPVLAAATTPKPGPVPERTHPLDVQYENLQRELRRTFETLGLAARAPRTNMLVLVGR